jgi:O-antigen/teichoic acid export membrane protein
VNIQKWRDKLSRHGAFAKNSFFLFFGSLIANVLNYAYHLVVGRQVSIEVYGEAESLISLIMIISVPAMTLGMVATKYAAACKADANHTGSREIWLYLNKKVLKFGVPIFLFMVLLTPLIGRYLNIESHLALIAIWVTMYISFFNAINQGLLSGWQKFKKVSLSNVLSTATKFFSGIILVGIGFALGGIVGSIVLSTVMMYVVTLIALHINIIRKRGESDTHPETKVNFGSLKRYILPVFVGNLAITILGNADMILAKHNLDDIGAGQYGALTVVSKIIFFATGVIASVLFSMSAEHSHKGESSRHILKTALFLVSLASLVATGIYFAYPTLILSILFGGKYGDAAPYLGWFAVAVSLYSFSNIIFQYLLSIHKTKIVYSLLTIALIMVLCIDVFGAKISTIISIVIIAQVVAIALGIYYLFTDRKMKNIRT